MAMTLRPYQAEAKEAILHEWSEGRRRTLLVLPTGCGKTVVLAKVAEDQVEHGGRVLIMAHRGELLDQAADKVKQVTGIDCAYEKAGASSLGSWMPITVGSVQSLCQEKRLQQFPPDYYSSVIVDEAHHCLSDSYQRVLEHFSDANVLGVTATPDRGDMRNLGRFFDSRAYEYTMSQAIREKYLCPVKAQMIPLKLDISDVGVSNGDYNVGEIGTALEPYLRQIAHEIAENYADRKTVSVFYQKAIALRKENAALRAGGYRCIEAKDRLYHYARSFNAASIHVFLNAGDTPLRITLPSTEMIWQEGLDCDILSPYGFAVYSE